MKREASALNLITQPRKSLSIWLARKGNNKNWLLLNQPYHQTEMVTKFQRFLREAASQWEVQELAVSILRFLREFLPRALLTQSLSILMKPLKIPIKTGISWRIRHAQLAKWCSLRTRLQSISVSLISLSQIPTPKWTSLNSQLVSNATLSKLLYTIIYYFSRLVKQGNLSDNNKLIL